MSVDCLQYQKIQEDPRCTLIFLLKLVSDAFLNAAFTASTVVSSFSVTTKSVALPVGVGTLSEFPFSLPAKVRQH